MGISHELSEEDVKFRYINDAITSKGWTKDSIFMEQQVKFTDGKISLHGNIVHREKPKFADYVLYVNKAKQHQSLLLKQKIPSILFPMVYSRQWNMQKCLMSNLRSALMEKVLPNMIF